jgi:hypothetical protein
MASEEIEITIAKDGSVQIQVRGVKGKTCLDLTRELESALGGIVLSREMTPEAGEEPDSAVAQPQAARKLRTKRAA